MNIDTKSKIIIIIITILLGCIIYLKGNKNKNNLERHLYDNDEYAHYSEINKQNILLHPKYILSSPKKYILREGDALIIPKKWWHWVFSYDNTFAINYWFKKDVNGTNYPKILYNFIKPFDILKNNINLDKNFNKIINWDGKKDLMNRIYLNDYINKKEKNNYLITLERFVDNDLFKREFSKYIEHNKFLIENNINDNYNLWYSIAEMDTGLHYDDSNGILAVLSGKKIVYLYPPEDSKYLYPLPEKPEWVTNKYEEMEYNIYKSSGKILDKINSSMILYKSYIGSPNRIYKFTDFLYNNFSKKNKIIYGIKNNNQKYYWEYYFYNIDKFRKSNKTVKNFDIYEFIEKIKNSKYSIIVQQLDIKVLNNFLRDKHLNIFSIEQHNDSINAELDLYINLNDIIELPYYGETYNFKKNIINLKYYFILDNLFLFLKNIDARLTYLKLLEYKEEIIEEINKYNYVKLMAIYNKNQNDKKENICIQWFGLKKDDMINFLINHKWKDTTIDFYKNNDLEHLSFEITINYKIENNKLIPVRTSIYGSF